MYTIVLFSYILFLHIFFIFYIICTQVYIHSMLCYEQAEINTINLEQQNLIW